MKTINLSKYGTIITQSKIGAVNEEVRHNLQNDSSVMLDFNGVRGIDSSAAHELVTSLRANHSGKVQMKNANPTVKSVLVFSSDIPVVKVPRAEKASFTRRALSWLFTLTLLLTLGVGQMWADAFWPYAGFYEVYMTYSYSGNNSNYTFYSGDNNSSQSVDLGTLSADFKVNSLYFKCYKNTGDWSKYGNLCGGLMIYNTGSGDTEYQPASWTWTDKNTWSDSYQAHLWELSKTSCNEVIASYNSGASGSYTAKLCFKMWGSDDNSSNCDDNWWISNNGNNYKFTYKIAPPAISSFSVSESGYLSGTGAENDPYIIPYNGTLTLTVSGSKGRTDGNSTIKYWKNSGDKQNSNVLTVTGITSTDKASVVVHAQCINNSSSSLVGTESTKTVYYKSEAAYSVTVSAGAHGSVSPSGAQSNIGTLSGLSVSATPSTGYNFNTWTISSGSGSFTSAATTASNKFKPTAASTITASFTAKQTTVTLSANAPGGQTVTGGGTTVTATYDSALPAFSALSCTGGYALKGYYDNTSGGNKIINADGTFNANSGIWNRLDGATLTLHAQWSLDRTLTYDGNGSTGGSVPASPTSYSNGASATVLGNTNSLVKTGYTFDGWNTEAGGGGSSYSAGSSITMNANYTLFAQWDEDDYTVTVTNGSNGSVESGSVTGHYDTKVTLPTATANTGYHFSTWTTTSGSVTYTNQTSATEAQVNGLTADATVRADFAANTYSVVFNANGGSGSMSSEAFTYDAAAKALTSNSFTKSGYTFVGWATSAARANAMNIDYTNGQSVQNLTSTNGGTFNLYAVWAKKYYIGGRFQHDWEEGSATTNEMTYDTSTRYYKFTTSKTVNELSVQWNNGGSYYADQYFYIHTGLGKGASSSQPTYVGASSNGHDMETKIGYSNAYVLTEKTSSFDSFADAVLLKFSNTDNLSSAVIVWWDPANRKVWYTATESLNTNYYLLGFGSGSWGETDARRFKVASVNATTATVSVSLTAKTYTYNTSDGFKVENGGTYYSNNSTMTRANCSNWSFTTGTNNCGITADLAGTYTFTLNLSNRQVSVTYPTAYTVNFGVSPAGSANAPTNNASISSGDLVANGTSITFTKSAANTGYTWSHWEKNSSNVGSENTYTTSITANTTINAVYTENTHTVTLANGGHGHVEINSATVTSVSGVGIATASGTITAVPDLGYYFTGWTGDINNGVTLASGTAASTSITIRATADSKTITANFASIWALVGTMNSWNDATNRLGNYSTVSTKDYGYVEVDLAANTQYSFKLKDVRGVSGTFYKPTSSNTEITYANKATAQGMNNTANGNPNQTIMTAGAGTYRFTWNATDHSIKVTYPTSYTVTFGSDGHASSVTATVEDASAITSGQYAASGKDVTFSQTANTGYEFAGWYTASSGGSPIASMASDNVYDNISANATVYAHYNAKTYTVTLDQQSGAEGYSASGSTSLTATYNAAFPSATMPTAAEGYAFMGYFDDEDGEGTQFTDASGNLLANIASYSDASGNWIYDGTKTLYAYYKKAEITALALDAAQVAPGETVGVTPTVLPTPNGTTTICWEVRYADSDNPLSPQPGMTWSDGKLTFAASETSGLYKIVAVLKTGNDCAAGTTLSTTSVNVQVAGSHTVTVAYKHSSTTIKASTSVTARPLVWSDEITAPDIFGYTFSNWTAVDGVTIKNGESDPVTTSTNATIQIKATYNGTLTANYTPKNIIYFKDNLEWTNPEDADAHIYVNLLTADYWNTDNGTGNKNVTNRNLQMDRVPGTTDIFYYDYGSKPTSNYISFTKEDMDNYENFYQAAEAHVVFPSRALDALGTNNATGLGFYAATPMFVPLATQTPVKKNDNHAAYYNDGYWTKYLPGTGYTLQIYNADGSGPVKQIAFASADELMPMKAVADLEGGHTYKFQLKRDGDVYYGNNGTMTYADHGQNTAWDFYNNSPFNMCTIVTNAAGDYTFNLSYSPNSGGTNNRLRISVDYPVASGDYRLVYTDNTRSGRIKPSAIVAKENDGTATVSFFVRKDQSPVLRIQQATVALDGTITWKEYPTDGTPTNQITGSIASAITATGVWNFNLEMNGSGAMSVASAEAYKGNYYIRTDAANSKWDNYRTDPDHLMTYSDYLKSDVDYTHYYTHWVDKDETGRKNVKFVIANDYSPCISDTLIRETASGTWANIASFITTGGDLIRSANVRFMWDEETNNIARAYIDGAQGTGSDIFLRMLSSDSRIKQGETVKTSVAFQDNGNWIYEANVLAQPEAQIKLKSTWGSGTTIEQYFKGSESETESLVGGSGDDWYPIRVLYDFKTNRLVAAYLPTTGTISSDIEINADVMFIREHHGDIAQLTFSGSGAISDIKTAYGVLRLNKWTINNKSKSEGHAPLSPELSRYERDLFYISFPFRVNLEEVFGFGTYGTHWIIEEYDGAARAANGFWAETPTFWRFITNRKGKFLEPNQGYIVALDLDELGESSSVWANTDQVELYFPSYGSMPDIKSSSVTYNVPAHTCTINRATPDGDRRIKDSHWNVISVPTYINTSNVTFANTDWITAGDGKLGPNFLYTVNWSDNSLSATSGAGYTYKAMHAYIVQYKDNITWTTSVSPASIVAREHTAPSEVEFRIELSENEQTIDQTYVRLSNDEEVSTGFVFGEDMSKEFNKSKANIYTFIGTEQAAGNVLPMSEQTTVVPVGVKIVANGDYTFSIPDGTEGTGVTLIDNETGVHTNLALMDYTVALEAGTYDGRFILEISPIAQTPTGVDTISDEGLEMQGARKVIIDEKMYILKDGKVYDARGARIQ